MPLYLVRWSLHVEADSPEEAAEEARRVQLNPNSPARSFVVEDVAHVFSVRLDSAGLALPEGGLEPIRKPRACDR
jgi:hypothetical protein